MEVVASLSQCRTAAAQCSLFTHKSVPVIFEPPCILITFGFKCRKHTLCTVHLKMCQNPECLRLIRQGWLPCHSPLFTSCIVVFLASILCIFSRLKYMNLV